MSKEENGRPINWQPMAYAVGSFIILAAFVTMMLAIMYYIFCEEQDETQKELVKGGYIKKETSCTK
jgi:hypothetical protein